jgi:hypothetical protein
MDAIADTAIKELASFDEIVRHIVGIDYMLKDPRNTQALRTLLDRLQFIYFSRQGILPFLQRLQRQEKIEDHAWKDLSFNFPLERLTVANAGAVMHRHISDLKARFGEDISDFLIAIIDLKFAVRSVVEGFQTALRKDYFSADAVAVAAQTAAVLVPSAQALRASLAYALEKLDAYEPA